MGDLLRGVLKGAVGPTDNDSRYLIDTERERGDLGALESPRIHGQCVGSDRQKGELVFALIVRGCSAGSIGPAGFTMLGFSFPGFQPTVPSFMI